MGGVDASVLNEQPIERIEMVANERVEAKQIGNIVETTLPWKGESGLKVKVDLGEPTLEERMTDKRKKEVITETVTDFEGGFKVDILLNEKPDTNVFCYAIEGAENYDFFYQAPLTAEEIANGDNRAPEIEGSYAVYHKTLKNHQLGKENYATGKVMHIPRPQVWSLSDVETKVWADMNYSNGSLCVTVPQDFLDKAEYPVRVDPTFGYTSAGATDTYTGASTIRTSNTGTTLTENGNVTSIQFYGRKEIANRNFHVALYQGTTLISPQSVSSVAITSTSNQWWVNSFSGPTVENGQTYQVAVFTDYATGNGVVFRRDTGGVTGESYSDTINTYPTWDNPTTWVNSSSKYSIYATYTASGGGGATSTPQTEFWFD